MRGLGRAGSLLFVVLSLVAAALACTGTSKRDVATVTTTTSEPTTSSDTATDDEIGTQTVVVTVFRDGAPRPEIEIVLETTGSCEASQADYSRPEAHRCFLDTPTAEGTTIEDPCFADPSHTVTYLLCLRSPTSTAATKLEPSTIEASAGDRPALGARPWMIVLDDGRECPYVTGATKAIDDQRLNYSCPGGAIYGEPDRSNATWTVSYQADGTTGLTQQPVAIVYI